MSSLKQTDPRSLAALRIGTGLLLMLDLYRRFEIRDLVYVANSISDLDFFRGFAYSVFSSVQGTTLRDFFFLLTFLAYGSFLLGFRTRVAHLLTLVLYCGWARWNWSLIHGGHMLMGIMLLWTAFLPLGATWSWDSYSRGRSWRDGLLPDSIGPRWALLGARTQFCLVYFSSFIAKAIYHPSLTPGMPQHWLTGEAAYLSLNYKTVAYGPLSEWLALNLPEWMLRAMTWQVLAMEGIVPLLLLLAFRAKGIRRLSWLTILLFSLGTIATLYVGDIARMMIAFSFLFWRAEDWDLFAVTRSRTDSSLVPSQGEDRARYPKLELVAITFLAYANLWMQVETLIGKRLPSALRPDQWMLYQTYAVSGQNWDYFWNGPGVNHSFAFTGILPDGREINLEEGFLGGSRWDELREPGPPRREPIDGSVAYYGLLRFRYLDSFFNFGYRKPGEQWPSDLGPLARHLANLYRERFGVQLSAVQVQRIDRWIPSLAERHRASNPSMIGATWLWKF